MNSAPSFRPGQKRAVTEIAQAFEDGYQFVVLDAPTGSGKSVINTAIARSVRNAYYTTPQNSLIDQVTTDDLLNDYFTEVKGRRNYPCKNPDCPDFPTAHSAELCPVTDREMTDDQIRDTGICCHVGGLKRKILDEGFDIDDFDACRYPQQVVKALQSPLILTNMHYYILSPHFAKRHLTILDEAHNLEKIGFSFCDISLSRYTIPFFDELGEIPREPAALREWCVEELKWDIRKRLNDDSWVLNHDDIVVERLQRLLDKIRKVKDMDTDFVVGENPDRVGGVTLKPLYVQEFFQRYVFPRSERFLLSSATFVAPKKQLRDVGVPADEVKVVSMKNRFPVKNRPIRREYVADMRSSEVAQQDYRTIARKIKEIAENHSGEKGVVHCVSYSRQETLSSLLSHATISDRILTHDSSDRDAVLEEFKESTKPLVFLTVGMEEGIDLKEELARFNILVKVPNPSMGDDRYKTRAVNRNEWDWYFRQTAMNIVQAYGRTTRSAEDTSETYILDENFQSFYQKNKYLLPEWFKQAVSFGARQSPLAKSR